MVRRSRVVLALLLAAATACGISAVGEAVPQDAAAPVPGIDAAQPAVTPDASAPDTAIPDAGPPCEVKVEDSFGTALDETRWLRGFVNNDDYPKLANVGGPVLSLIAGQKSQASGAVWLKTELPFEAFDIGLDFDIGCTNQDCADGMAVVWVATTDPARLVDTAPGSGLGIPRGTAGTAVAVDLFRSSGIQDPLTPNLSILGINGTAEPGTYNWTLVASPQNQNLVGARRRLDLTLRHNTLDARVDGVSVVNGLLATMPVKGSFGIVAATGQDYARFAVKSLKATFYRCNVPDAGF
jgi:hypothetical protein